MITRLVLITLLFGGAPAVASPDRTLADALLTEPAGDILAAWYLARVASRGCAQVAFVIGIGHQDAPIPASRSAELEPVDYDAIDEAAIRQSDQFDAKYGVSFRLVHKRPSDYDAPMCDAIVREAQTTTLLGLMLDFASPTS